MSLISPMIPHWITKELEHGMLTNPGHFTPKHRTSNHVAFIFKGRKLLAKAQNKLGGRNTIHAEAAAIRAVGDTNKLRGALLVVIRLDDRGCLQNSAPCKSCQVLLKKCQREYGLLGCIHS